MQVSRGKKPLGSLAAERPYDQRTGVRYSQRLRHGLVSTERRATSSSTRTGHHREGACCFLATWRTGGFLAGRLAAQWGSVIGGATEKALALGRGVGAAPLHFTYGWFSHKYQSRSDSNFPKERARVITI